MQEAKHSAPHLCSEMQRICEKIEFKQSLLHDFVKFMYVFCWAVGIFALMWQLYELLCGWEQFDRK